MVIGLLMPDSKTMSLMEKNWMMRKSIWLIIPETISHSLHVTLSLGAGYVHNFGYGSFIDRIVANLQYTGVGKIYWTESNEDVNGEELYQPFYGLVNGSISAEKGSFALELWGKNLLGKDYNSFLFEATDMTTGNTNSFVQRGYPTLLVQP